MRAKHPIVEQPPLMRLASALVGCTELDAVALGAVRALDTGRGATWVLLVRHGNEYSACAARPINHDNVAELAARACARGATLNAARIPDAIIPFASEPLWCAQRDAAHLPELVLGVWVDPGHPVPTPAEMETALEFIGAATAAAREVERLRHQSHTDALTGLLNRRGILSALAAEERRSARHHHPVGVLLADVDDFKSINDRFSHATGDRALQAIGAAMQRTLRASDLVGRLGGDEFLAVLPHCTEAEARRVAARLAREIATVSLSSESGVSIHLSATIGAAGNDATSGSLVDLADRRMLSNKRRSRLEVVEPALAVAV